jgi:hypothetical protein
LRSTHGNQQAQCTHCHTHAHPAEAPTVETPNYTGHSFKPTLESCVECHKTEEAAEALVTDLQREIKQRILDVKTKLDLWAQTKAPEALRNKYGATAWEYSTAGQLSNPKGLSTIKGPTATEQPSVPQAIKEARFYLYMVEHDGSYGVHNNKYARLLLNAAETNVVNLLNAP